VMVTTIIAFVVGSALGTMFGGVRLIRFLLNPMTDESCHICKRPASWLVLKWHKDGTSADSFSQLYCDACENFYSSMAPDELLPPWVKNDDISLTGKDQQ
jgi:hypothetical protein